MDAELPSVSTTTTPKARKQHDCCECDVPILPGQCYERVEGCWDGEWRTYKTCIPCENLRAECSDDGLYEYGSLRDSMLNGPLAPTSSEVS